MTTDFDNLITSEYWKFFTDVKQWGKNDPEAFDKEESPGYFRNCSMALWWMLKTYQERRPVDLDYIITLRNLAYHNDAKPSRGLALNNVMSGIGPHSFTEAGLRQLMTETAEPGAPSFSLHIKSILEYDILLWEKTNNLKFSEDLLREMELDFEQKKTRHLCRNSPHKKNNNYILIGYSQNIHEQSLEDIAHVANSYLSRYQDEIMRARSTDDKLIAIVKIIQSLHQFHLFPDGNGRTFCFFLLNQLLLEQDLPPTIIEDPGWFTGWSREELVGEVKKGQLRFQSLCSPLDLETSLTERIKQQIKLSPIEEKQLFVSAKQRTESGQLFAEAVRTQDKQQQINILESMPFHECVFFIKKQLSSLMGEQKEVAQEWLEQLRLLQWCGVDNYPSLCQTVIQHTSFTDSKELLLCLHRSPFASDPHWRQVVTDMIKREYVGALKALIHAMNTAIELEKNAWFDTEKYTAMLLRTSNYSTFSLTNNTFLGTKWSKYSLALLKEYLYQAPESANALFSIVHHVNHAELSYYRYILPLQNNKPSDRNICFYLDNQQVCYKIKLGADVIEINLEEKLSQRISPEELAELKKHIDALPRQNIPKFFEILKELAEEITPDPRIRKSEISARQQCERLLTHPEASKKFSYVLGDLTQRFFAQNKYTNPTFCNKLRNENSSMICQGI
jgi:hypothetical protein